MLKTNCYKQRLITFAIMVTLLASLVFGARIARADSLTYDFTASESGWALYPIYSGSTTCGTWTGGSGWHQQSCGGQSELAIQIDFGYTIHITSFVMHKTGLGNNSPSTRWAWFCGTDEAMGGGTGSETITGTINCDSTYLRLQVDTGGTRAEEYITSVDINGSGLGGPTPTPSPTTGYINPSSTITPEPSQVCTVPDSASAVFQPGNGWTFLGGADYAIPSPPRWLDLPPGGSATMSANLSGAEYTLSVIYQSAGLGGGSFIASVGGQPYAVFPTDSAQHTFEIGPIKYTAGATTLGLSKPASDAVNVTIKSFCLNAVQGSAPAPAIQAGTNGNNDQCTTCDPPLNITDIPGILNWLICNLRRLVTCYLLPLLSSILGFIGTIIKFILSFFAWVVKGAGDILAWVGNLLGSIWGSITGWISNLFAGASNSFHTSGLADDTNIIASRTRDLPTAITNGIANFGGQFHDIFFEPAANILDFVVRLVSFAAGLIAYVLGLIPLVIQSLIDGINSSSTPISGSSVCSDPNALVYFPCLGFYLLDNTLFQGPAGYLIPVLIAVIVFDQITWAFTRIKEELSK